jgi:addiction module HigA family antidote
MIPRNRKPTAPGEILLEEFLKPAGMTQSELADASGLSTRRINAIINGRSDVTAEMAIRLSRALKTTSEFWMNLQVACDLYAAAKRLGKAA